MKPIIGFEDYLICENGKIYSIKNNRIELKQEKTLNGYLRVTLFKNNKRHRFLVHRLVALNFIYNLKNKKIINHINGIKTDNRVINLEWVTPSENCQHSIKNNLTKFAVGEVYNRSHLKESDILQIRKIWKEKSYSQPELAKMFNTTRSTINAIVNYYSWRHLP